MKSTLSFLTVFSVLAFGTTGTQPSGPASIHVVEFFGGWGPSRAVYFTGFGPFGYISDNPSGRVVGKFAEEVRRQCPAGLTSVRSSTLPVKPGIIESIHPERFDTVISVGVAAGSDAIRIEQYAENWYEDGNVARVISDAYAPKEYLEGPRIPQNMPTFSNGFDIELGTRGSAGTFVCNETFFRLCLNHRKGYFIHIPNITTNQDSALATSLAQIACRLFQ